MPKITQFDRTTIPAFREAIQKALEPVAAEFGVVVTMRGGSFQATNYSPKIEFAVQSAEGIVLSREALDFKMMAALYQGLAATDLGATFTSGGETYKITGLATRSSKRPILAENVRTKRTYKFTDQDVARLLVLERRKGGAS